MKNNILKDYTFLDHIDGQIPIDRYILSDANIPTSIKFKKGFDRKCCLTCKYSIFGKELIPGYIYCNKILNKYCSDGVIQNRTCGCFDVCNECYKRDTDEKIAEKMQIAFNSSYKNNNRIYIVFQENKNIYGEKIVKLLGAYTDEIKAKEEADKNEVNGWTSHVLRTLLE